MSEKNPIREEIDKIEPADGARERMLQNIKRKAAEQKPEIARISEKKPVLFTKIVKWAAPLAACIVAAAVGIVFVSRQNQLPVDDESNVMVGNPYGDFITTEELREQLQIDVRIPDGAEVAECFIIDGKIGNITFTYNQKSYRVRVSEQSGDFSGVNETVIARKQLDAENNAVLETLRGMDYTIYKLFWTNGSANFYLVNISEISENDFISVYNLIK